MTLQSQSAGAGGEEGEREGVLSDPEQKNLCCCEILGPCGTSCPVLSSQTSCPVVRELSLGAAAAAACSRHHEDIDDSVVVLGRRPDCFLKGCRFRLDFREI